MSEKDRKRSLVVMRQSPYGSSLSRASVDLALAMGAFEQDYDLLFMGPGVLQLVAAQDSEKIGVKNIGRILSSLPLYDMESVYVDAAALERYGLNEASLVLPVKLLDDPSLRSLLNDSDHLIGC
ncbi:MAG: sulfurtransferase complex subunit TusC [Halioglobus sp.]